MANEEHYSKKLLSNTLIFGIGNFSSRILIFFLVPLYTRTLTSIDYGYIDLLTITITLFLPFFTLNIHEAVIRFSLDKKTSNESVIAIGMKTVLVGILPVIIITPIIMRLLGTGEYIIYFFVAYILSAMKHVLTYYARGTERVRLVVILGILDTGLLLILNLIFLLVLNLGIDGYFYSLIISSTIVLVLYILLLKINIRSIFSKNDKALKRKMLSYSIPMIPNSISWWISNTSDKYILNFFWGVSTTGIYAVAYKIPSLLNTITKIFMEAWQISAVEEYESNNNKNFSEVFRFFFGVNILVCLGIVLFSNVIALIMFSDEFYSALKFVPILLSAFFFNGLASYLGTVYTASKKTNMLFISTSIGALINITLNIILIPNYGGYGAAIATLISYFIIWLIRLINSRKIMTLEFNVQSMIVQIASLLIVTTFMSLEVSPISMVLIAVFSGLIVISNIFVVKAITKLVIRQIRRFASPAN